MIITIDGIDGQRADQLERSARFYANRLFHPRTIPNLRLDIEVRTKIADLGNCANEEDKKNPRWFTIQLRDDDDSDIENTLAHEMVHAKQYAYNQLEKRLVVTSRGFKLVSFWMGEPWKPKKDQDVYFDSPWEIEAYGREVGLFHAWVNHYNVSVDQ